LITGQGRKKQKNIMTVYEKLQIKVLNSSFYKEDTDLEGIFPSEKSHQHLRELLSEYYSLIRQSNVSEQGADRISEILELAEHDRLLDECIDKIDQALNVQSEIKPKTLSTDELLIQLRKLSTENRSNDDLARCFSELVHKFQINHELIDSFIEFNPSTYHLQTVLNQSRFQLFIICWQPGQKTTIHQNFRYFTETLVYKGELTKTKFKRMRQNGNANLVKNYEQVYSEGEWLSIDKDELHQLANLGSENLVTIHFKYINSDDRDIDIAKDPIIITQPETQDVTKLDRLLEVTY
jgi:predicted metal-dependent enzyme (double-stranded beta helix superfamily)